MSPEPDILTITVHDGDVFLLCSDGLCGAVPDSTIKKTLDRYFDNVEMCCQQLVKRALEAGGEDNVTVALLSSIPDSAKTQRSFPLLRLFRPR